MLISAAEADLLINYDSTASLFLNHRNENILNYLSNRGDKLVAKPRGHGLQECLAVKILVARAPADNLRRSVDSFGVPYSVQVSDAGWGSPLAP